MRTTSFLFLLVLFPKLYYFVLAAKYFVRFVDKLTFFDDIKRLFPCLLTIFVFEENGWGSLRNSGARRLVSGAWHVQTISLKKWRKIEPESKLNRISFQPDGRQHTAEGNYE